MTFLCCWSLRASPKHTGKIQILKNPRLIFDPFYLPSFPSFLYSLSFYFLHAFLYSFFPFQLSFSCPSTLPFFLPSFLSSYPLFFSSFYLPSFLTFFLSNCSFPLFPLSFFPSQTPFLPLFLPPFFPCFLFFPPFLSSLLYYFLSSLHRYFLPHLLLAFFHHFYFFSKIPYRPPLFLPSLLVFAVSQVLCSSTELHG